MDLAKLVTLAFDKNVGPLDRLARLVSGLALVALGLFAAMPVGARVALAVFGSMWTATGLLSKCSIYYALGYSTRPRAPRRSPPGEAA